MRYNIIDGQYELNRCVFSSLDKSLSTSDGLFIGGLFYFLKSLKFYSKIGTPITVYDASHHISRTSIFPDYKKNRKEKKEKLEGYDLIKKEETWALINEWAPKLLPAMGIPFIRITGMEADDLVYAYSKKLVDLGFDTTVTSEDFDYFQCLNTGAKVYKPRKKTVYTVYQFVEEYKYPPSWISLMKSIDGDKKDGVEGIRGLGPKGIAKLFHEIKETGVDISMWSVHNYCENIEKPKSIHKKIVENKELIQMNFKLKDLDQVPLDNALIMREYSKAKKLAKLNPEFVIETFKRFEFFSLLEDPWYVGDKTIV